VTEPREAEVNQGGGEPPSAASQLFDLRTIIAVLFAVYGAVLTVLGILFVDPTQLRKAAGIDIKLWAGVAMLVVAVLFVLWQRLRPLVPVERGE
jgi:uncharacterized membrane protein